MILRSLIGAVVLMTTAVFAGEPAYDLDPKVAVKLICQRTNLLPERVEVAFVVDGSTKNQDGFETRHVRRVAALHPVVDGGSLTDEFQALDRTEPEFQFATVVALFGMKLRGMDEVRDFGWDKVIALATLGPAKDATEDRAEAVGLLKKLGEW